MASLQYKGKHFCGGSLVILFLITHMLDRTDDENEKVETHCQDVIEIAQSDLDLFAAKEGMCIDFDDQ